MKGRTVILAAGEFPHEGGEPFRLLASAERVVACDSAADAYRRVFRKSPNVIVGDFDSLQVRNDPCARYVQDGDGQTNDLSKAIAFCAASRWENPIVVGATGKREDHTIGNVFRALEAQVRLVTEDGEFVPVWETRRLRTWKNLGVSVFTLSPRAKMSSEGLQWPLDGVSFSNPYCATLNRAASEDVVVTSSEPAFVFLERNRAASRAVVSLGSNMGDREGFLKEAASQLKAFPETRLVDESSVIETEGLGVPEAFSHLKFLNQVLLLETTLSPFAFSRAMHEVEDRLGRTRTVRNGPRTIDVDLIDFGGLSVATDELTLPHPRAHERDFVLAPMREIGLF